MKNNNIIKSVFYEDEIKGKRIRTTIHDGRAAGLGKSYRVINKVIKNKDRNHLIIAPRHDLLDEYTNAFDEGEVAYAKLEGFKKSCTVMLNAKDPAYDDVIYMYDKKKALPYTICMSVKCKHQDNCKYKKQWADIRDEDNNICKTVLMPANLLPVVELSEFSGQIFIDENCDDIEPFKFNFNAKDIQVQIRKLEKYHPKSTYNNMGYMNAQEFEDLKNAISNMHVPTLNRLQAICEETIYQYNLHVIEKSSRLGVKFICRNLCNLRVSNIITCLDFYLREMKHDVNDTKWNWTCKVEGAIRDLSIYNTRINACSLQIRNKMDEFDDAFFEKLVLEKKKIELMNDLMVWGQNYRIDSPNVDFSKEYDWDKVDLYSFLEGMLNFQLPIPHKSESMTMEIYFPQSIKYKHLNSFTTLNFSDTTFRYRTEYYIQDILKFKQLFPEYKVKCELIEQEVHTDSVILFPSNNNCRFPKGSLKKQWKAYKKEIQNRISYLKKQGKNPCILTYMDLIKKDDGTLCGVPAYHFGSAGGVNCYQEHDALIVVGTFLPSEDWFQKNWNRYYAAERGVMPTLSWDVDEKKRTTLPSDATLLQMFKSLWLPDKIYNAVHRVRPVRHPVDIYWYGNNAPEILQAEMNVRFF